MFKPTPFLLLIVILILPACQSNYQRVTPLSSNIYLDQSFQTEQQIETEQEIFALTKPMQKYVSKRLNQLDGVKNKTKQLIQDLFSEQQMNIGYKHNANYTAANTFELGEANCLSLTILAYVLVKEAQLSASFIDVTIAENWSQFNGISMLNGHVNLQVGENKTLLRQNLFSRTITIDFIPEQSIPVIKKTVLTKKQITALFYNNKGAHALALGQFNLAYNYFSTATKYAPFNASIWGNLASLYRQRGFFSEAETIYNHALKLAPNNLTIQENLAYLYKATQRPELANVLLQNIERQRLSNPYYHAMLAQRSYFEQDYQQAVTHFKRAIRKNREEHTFYFGLAKAYLMLNDFDSSNRYLSKAKALSAEQGQKQIYQNKLSALARLTAKTN